MARTDHRLSLPGVPTTFLLCSTARRRRFAYLSPIPNRSGTRAISMQQHEVQNDSALPSTSRVSFKCLTDCRAQIYYIFHLILPINGTPKYPKNTDLSYGKSPIQLHYICHRPENLRNFSLAEACRAVPSAADGSNSQMETAYESSILRRPGGKTVVTTVRCDGTPDIRADLYSLSMLLDLSVELLEAIGAQLTQGDYAILRTVCKELNGAFGRLFFSILVLKTNRNGLSEDGVQMLKALATGRTGWSLHAKTLHIIPAKAISQESEPTIGHDKPVDVFATALASLWHVHDQEFWEWGRTTILDFLNTLATLDDLELNILANTINLSALQVRSLRKFTLKSPGRGFGRRHFTGLTPMGTRPPPPMYQDIAQLVSQNRLNSLHLEGITEWSAVWRLLRSKTNGTRLAEITTNVVTHELFDYLTSYSGIEKLTLKFPDGGDLNESNRLADTFFETVLPLHAEYLSELSCPAAYESRFSFGTHNVNIVSLLHKLTKLEMSINAGAVRIVDNPETYIDHNGKRYPVMSIGVSVEAEQADIDPVVTLLLETTATFPALRSLTIVSAETERNRGAWCGNGRINHTGAVDVAIAKAVKAFRTDAPCSAVVRAGYYTYELQPLCGPVRSERGLAYEQTGRWSRY
ncbi:hypothetical protein B0H12DRAFT_1217955 [Mycena haematopus]|nr:hypothetical protein B0H12DRAFT_1217955 [Mycena haematopus]